MTIIYHGTDIDSGILIARSGAILSPWEKTIETLKRFYREHPSRNFKAEHPRKTIEQYALRIASLSYGKRELEHRVKCISVSTKLVCAKGYTLGFEEDCGGIVLGVEVDDSLIKNPNNHHVLYIPKKLSIEGLKELHLSHSAEKKHGEQIRQEFYDYNPFYFILE